ncbi:LuxR C-terminal-related transcriptional regulator [Sporosarcina sp. NPDC096371]|uniref:LuxR C-terminal-related transcriptional regulator n=1 Tax=Sporosarcina sp. NPDC096371 TaxID=3364530 RepID=UPI0037FA8764
MQPIWLESKITVPIVSEKTIERRRLNELLGQKNLARISIIRAPAGYGKTTMLSQWGRYFDGPVAWLSIDATDNDPVRFLKYLIRTVAHAHHNEMDLHLLSHFKDRSQLPIELLVDSFLNELGSMASKVHIVIDDYHLIENSSIHNVMTRIIDYLPSNCNVYIASRTELPLPLAKWRVRSWLVEIGMQQLCFTYGEVKQFYEKQSLVMDDAHALQHVWEITEGWPAGIQLAGLSLSTSEYSGWSLQQFDGGDSFVTEFLLKEILATLPSATQDFLICTAILDRLDPSICDSLTNRSDSLDILLELERLGLFIVRLHTKEPTFRYHHLFAESLQGELKNRYAKDVICSMYQKAATIYRENSDFISAIELAMNGQSYELAEEWINTFIVDILAAGQASTFIRWVQTFLRNNYAVHPETMVMYAYTLALDNKLEESYRLIANLESQHEINQWMDNAEYRRAAGDFLGVKAYILILRNGDIEQAGKLMRKRLENRPKNSKWNSISIQHNQVEPTLLRTSIGGRGKLWQDEEVMAFFELFRQTVFKDLNMTGYSYGIRAEMLYERNRVKEALPELEEALRYGHRFKDPGLLVPMYLLKSRIYMVRKQFVAAHALLDYAMERVKEHHWLNALYAMKVQVYLQENNIFHAEREFSKITMHHGCKVESRQPFCTLTHVRLLLAKKQPGEALKFIIQAKTRAMQEGQVSTNVEASVLEAICQAVLMNEDAALEALHEALEQGKPYGYVRTFLDEADIASLLRKYMNKRQSGITAHWDSVPYSYAEQLLEDNKDGLQLGGAMDALTPREQEVLQLLAGGATNREIASRLFLSEGTVRVYLSNIYGKLGVNSRTQAVLLVKEGER